MGKVGRNDPCPCGSGIKYKNCCLMKDDDLFSIWRGNCRKIAVATDDAAIISDTYLSLLEYARAKNLFGACHTISSALYVMLKEQGVSSILIVGGAKVGNRSFGHSWVELDGQVFDIAVYKTNDPTISNPPVYYGIDLATNTPTKVEYDVPVETGHMRIINQLLSMSVSDYMSGGGQRLTFTVWDIVRDVALKNHINIDLGQCIKKYSQERWVAGKQLGI